MTNDNFEVLYNALSVGWHLRKIAEVDPEPMTPEQWARFVGWLERHNLKQNETNAGSKKNTQETQGRSGIETPPRACWLEASAQSQKACACYGQV